MKRNQLLTIALFIVVVTSCNDDIWKEKSPSQQTTEITDTIKLEVFPDSVRQHLLSQDSLNQCMINRIDSLTMILNNSNSEIDNLKGTVEQLKEPTKKWKFIAGIGCVLALLSIVFSIVLTIIKVSHNGAKRACHDYLGESMRIRELYEKLEKIENNLAKNSGSRTQNESFSTGMYKISLLESRIGDIENKIREKTNVAPKMDNNLLRSEATTPNRNGYARINSGNYFTEILDTKSEDSVYIISFNNPDKGEFNLISLDKIKSRNEWDKIVDIIGDSTKLDEYTGYSIKEIGLCEKSAQGMWKITRKLKIQLKK